MKRSTIIFWLFAALVTGCAGAFTGGYFFGKSGRYVLNTGAIPANYNDYRAINANPLSYEIDTISNDTIYAGWYYMSK